MTTITALPTAPARTDTPAVFVPRADAWVASLGTFVTETNVVVGEVNANAVTAAADAVTAADAATTAAAASNFIGNWAAQTGAKTVPTSVAHNGETWILLSDIADITLKEPGVASEWQITASLSLAQAQAAALSF